MSSSVLRAVMFCLLFERSLISIISIIINKSQSLSLSLATWARSRTLLELAFKSGTGTQESQFYLRIQKENVL